MKIPLVFNAFVKQIAIFLKKYNFKKQGNNFYKQGNGNWGLISLQKSVSSTSSEILFTINIGICSYVLLEFFNAEKAKNKPIISDCHWRERIGILIGGSQDVWWKVNASTNFTLLIQEIEELLTKYALPFIDQYISDEQLADFWYSKLPWLNFRPKLDLAILLKKIGKIDESMLVLNQLEKDTEGKTTATTYKFFRKKLLKTN